MSETKGMQRALRELVQNPNICKACKKIIQDKLNKLDAKEAEWTRNVFYNEPRIPA